MRAFDSILDTIGRTPLVRLDSVVPDDPEILAKVESFNPGGSVKDRIGLSMIEAAEAAGELEPGGTIVEGTSGNTGIGLAIAARLKGYDVVFTMPDKMAVEKERLLRAYGAEVVRCPTAVEPDDPRSYYSVARRLAEEDDNAVYVNQYFNDANPEAHIETTGPEIWEDTDGRVTHYVAGVGTGGTISGTGRYLKDQDPDVRVVGIDPEGSILADRHATGETHPEKAHPYLIEGIGEDLVPDTVWFDVIDDMVVVRDQESFEMTHRLADEEGILTGSSSGAAVVGVNRAYDQGIIDDESIVVVILPDTGERYLSSTYEPAWLRAKGLWAPARTVEDACANPLPAVEPDADLEAILRVADAREVPAVAVVEGDTVLGLIHMDDVFAELVADETIRKKRASSLAGSAPPRIDAGTRLGDTGATLAQHEALLVTKDGEPFGLLTRRAALAHMGRI